MADRRSEADSTGFRPAASGSAVCRICLLGSFSVHLFDRTITRFSTRKTASLLAYLAFYAGQRPSREVLIEMLWPEGDPAAGRQSLSQALTSLRRQLTPPDSPGGPLLHADRFAVGLNEGSVSSDVAEFERSLRAAAAYRAPELRSASLEKALDLYSGPLLPGFYDSWIVGEQARLSDLMVAGALQLAVIRQESGDLPGAAEVLRRALLLEPLREEPCRRLMRLLHACGEPAAALHTYANFAARLRNEIGEEPSAAAQLLAEEIRRSKRSVCSPTPKPAPVPAPERAPDTARRLSQVVRLETGNWDRQPLPPAAVRRGFVPRPLSRFFGRREESASLCSLLAPGGSGARTPRQARLVTLTGPGGAGKTRLALEVARELLPSFRGAVWFVPLAEETRTERILDAIITAIRAPRSPADDSLAVLAGVLSGSPSLLVLDNFEQLVDGGNAVVQRLLEEISTVSCLVTSRRVLGINGERELALPPLPTPAREQSPGALQQNPSVCLFVDRAQSVRTDFQVTEANAPAVADLCCRLQGNPLSLELAAARVQVLTPAQMVHQMGRQLDFLTSRRSEMPERHRSARAAVEWSYRLLPGDLQRFLSRLSVFRGGWSLRAAMQVCLSPPAAELEGDALLSTIDRLSALRECSLVQATDWHDETRYTMLDVVREYAWEQLEASEITEISERHATYALQLAARLGQDPKGDSLRLLSEEVTLERDNIRAALRWTLEACPEMTLRMVSHLWRFWDAQGAFTEGREWLRRALERTAGYGDIQLRLLVTNGAANLAFRQADYATARALHEENLEAIERTGLLAGTAGTLNDLGLIAHDLGDFAAARSYLERSLALVGEVGSAWMTAVIRCNLAVTLCALGELERARTLLDGEIPEGDAASPPLQRERLGVRATLALREEDLREARQCLVEALTDPASLHDRLGTVQLLWLFGQLLYREGNPESAVRLVAASDAARSAMGASIAPGELPRRDQILRLCRERLGESRFHEAQHAGSRLSLEEATEAALSAAPPVTV